MKKLRVMLCCGAGMSSGFLAQKTRQAAKKSKTDIQIDARSESQVMQYLNTIDILLLGPHFSSQLPTYEKLSNDHNFQVFVIPKNIYSTLDGKSLLDFVLENYKETDHHE
ncbi:PTS sugar transporter subunit IIB [Erysipelotrichaceae bacterium AF15-26LB]|nr:PTS system, Lactose/Cellobiose specific IIB subunit [Erysipelotrichaceae bacterium 3_1_53]MCR0348111.1 PTS sugar transporter subunit IIB [[Clostridium] innocuum]RJV90939.1 PTS sugar transporter subunit IIB [Erysipelotrichaceae bacterium AF19-24AC]RJV91107.1 PTS sugar transporter subunit IIB [Erysipelotrichaceae bacterium AF15-26LB]